MFHDAFFTTDFFTGNYWAPFTSGTIPGIDVAVLDCYGKSYNGTLERGVQEAFNTLTDATYEMMVLDVDVRFGQS